MDVEVQSKKLFDVAFIHTKRKKKKCLKCQPNACVCMKATCSFGTGYVDKVCVDKRLKNKR